MGFAQCRPPYWRTDDFTKCVTNDILQILSPVIIAGLSATILLSIGVSRAISSRRQDGYEQLPTHATADTAEDDDSDDFAEHLSLRRTITRDTADMIIKLDKPPAEKFAVIVEILCLLGLIGAYLAEFILSGTTNWLPLVPLATWLYTLGLVVIRLSHSGQQDTFGHLWDHTALIYLFNFICLAVPFRSVLIHPETQLQEILMCSKFALVGLLCIITVSVRKGNSVVVQEVQGDLEPSREPVASLFSLASFSWVDGIVWQGYWTPLKLEDVWALRNDDVAMAVLSNFRQTKKTASLAWTLVKHFKRDLIIQALWAAFASLFIFAPTLLLRVILEYIDHPEDTPANVPWLFVTMLLITASIVAVGNGQALYIGRRICIRLRAVIIGEVYAKALRRKAAAGAEKDLGDPKKDDKKDADGKDDEKDEGQANAGAIINLMAVDSFKVSEVCAYLHFLVAAVPVQVVIAVVLLYQILGWSSIAGISIMVILMPLNYIISARFSAIQKDIMAATDKRIHTTNEVLQNIRIIKYFAWEERFGQVVNETRTHELKQLRNRYILWAIAATSWYGSPLVITFLSFLSYTVIEKKDLNAPVAFTALSLFNVLRVPLDQLADMVTNVLQAKVSVDRVEEFLKEEETEKYHQLRHSKDLLEDPEAPVIGFKDASFTWGSKQQAIAKGTATAFQLQDLNIEFCPGELNLIAGATGSGKTSLLMALLGEMTHLKGSVYLPGEHSREDLIPDPQTGLTDSVAYCSQSPWLVNDTIRNNILFAAPFNNERYHAVMIACSLERDFQILDHGDSTEVGEKGISLSGGQKQRISLARALYSNSKHLLLDDCLSAVDSHTAKWIYDYCITGPLMQGRTCILVTHNVALCLPAAKHVVVMDNGRVLAQGSPDEVVNSGALGVDEQVLKSSRSRPHSRMPSRVPSFVGEDATEESSANREANGHANGNGTAANGANTNGTAKPAEDAKKQASNEETKSEGSVSWKVYAMYLAAMGPWWYWVLVVAIFLLQQVGSVATSVWIRQWAAKYETSASSNTSFVHSANVGAASFAGTGCSATGSCVFALPTLAPSSEIGIASNSGVNVWYYLSMYALLAFAYVFLSFLREVIVFAGSLKASRDIHNQLLHNVMRAKGRFFDSTPLGRIMNRFSKDLEAVDQEVAPVALGMIHSLGSVIAIVILITIITPGFLFAGLFITFLYVLIGIFYLRASRDLKRIESIQRSPLYQHFGETLSGIPTIRAYGDERRFVRDNLQKIDDHNRPFFYLWACNRWLGFRVDIAGALVAFFAGAFVVLNVGKIDAGLAGLSLTYAITFTDNVLWVVRLYAINEQNMNSVERVREYIEVDQEAPEIIPDNRPPTSWPEKGAVTFTNYSTRYRPDLDLVLKGVSFSVSPGEKVGIVGRTGAGKSSLTLAMFRSLEAETGKIEIDGIDISTIGLRDLRQSITMVPQDPTLFTGTIRSNLDPFGIHTDAEIFSSLRRVQLISELPEPAAPVSGDAVDNTTNKNIFLDLSSPVSESGNNLSQGQRQLVCLARALLRAPKVLIMDEATAAIDYKTDLKIQETIRELDCTTITIAHRLRSVVDYDKICVLDQGEVKEFDHPWKLIQMEGGIFRGMCESSDTMDQLREVAKEAWEKKFGVSA
ncbi:P-loop containing nucleoside triphosphate hydrolase protein [Pyronema domesticum]|nr:P-loop containing nucleoside triphosphate hydrolase protein [Pyronema domesticum]